MRLNLPIIFEELGDMADTASVPEDVALDLAQAAVYSKELSSIEDGVLFILSGKDVRRFLSTAPGHSFVIVSSCQMGELDELLASEKGWIRFDDSVTLAQALAAVCAIFRKYADWEERIFSRVAHHADLHEVLTICGEPLVNPFALFDVSSTLLGISGEPPAKPDVVWDTIRKQGYYPLEMSSADIEKRAYESSVPIRVRVARLGINMAVGVLRLDSRPVANIGTTEVDGPITVGQLSILHAVLVILEKSNAMEFLLSYSRHEMSYPLQCLLRGNAVEEGTVAFALTRWGCKASDTFRVLFFLSGEDGGMSEDDKLDLSQRLDRILSDGVISPFDDGVVAILKQPLSKDDELALAPLLERRRVRCAISDSFSPIAYLRFAYLQCRAAMSLPAAKAGSPVVRFSDRYEECVMSSLRNSLALEALCNPTIWELSKTEHGREFILSLKTYLLNGRNVSDSARKLFLHRNTLIYRIDRMEALLGIDFGKADDREMFHILLSCFIVERLPQTG